MNIPTAEEFIESTELVVKFDNTQDCILKEELPNLFIQFAKLHVEAAIKTCIEEAPSGSSTDTVSYEDVVEALKNCYPLENIK